MAHEQEKVLYQGSPSQIANFNVFLICAIIFLIAVFSPSIWKVLFGNSMLVYKSKFMFLSKAMFFLPVIWAAYSWMKVKNHKYKITSERFMESTGVLSRTTNELELFRVKDMTLTEPFALRMLGCGNIVMDTSDKSTPIVVLESVKDPREVIEIIRKNVDIMRTNKVSIREMEG